MPGTGNTEMNQTEVQTCHRLKAFEEPYAWTRRVQQGQSRHLAQLLQATADAS